MNYKEWAFHDVEPVYLQLVQKIEYAPIGMEHSDLELGEH